MVLSRGGTDSDPRTEAEHRGHQAELLRLPRSARQVVATRSGHLILMEQPEVVTGAIRELLDAAGR